MIVTIYGHTGVVGAQLYRWLKEQGVDVRGVSLDRTDGEPGGEWAFLCLPTPTIDGVQDVTAIADVMDTIDAPNIVIRSTVLPGTCDRLAGGQNDETTVYHWPEFLSARTAWEDFTHPRVRVVGAEDPIPNEAWLAEIEPLLPPVDETLFVTWETSEMLKYAHNIHGAMQVVYANTIYDACEQSGADWDMVRVMLPSLGYVSRAQSKAYWNIWKDGERGYAGACFPKDVAALLDYLDGTGELLEGMEAANARLRGVQ
jgi:UDP-glucose 6-dehydrogenase